MEPENESKVPQPTKETLSVSVQTLLMEIKDTINALDKAVTNKELKTTTKLSRQVRKYRNIIQGHHLLKISNYFGFALRHDLLEGSSNYNPSFEGSFDLGKALQARTLKTLELEAFIKILFILFFWREKQVNICLEMVKNLLQRIINANRRTLDYYSALLYFLCVRLHEKNGTDLSLRQFLLESYNKACVRSDEIGQSTLLNLLLRNYLRANQIDAAYNLIEKTEFPESKSNNEFCKYLYYTGRVKAVRREYADALDSLNQAIRKSPDSAKGFKIQCQKAAIVVQLLLGDIPNRQIFSDALIFANAYPYYKLIQVVLEGSLTGYESVVQKSKGVFQKDKLYTLILRLNQIVIRIGLRKIYLSYSKISLNDIGQKLNIPSADVQMVVAKALRDGILNGEIDHENRVLIIEGDRNLYVTNEPQMALNKRIRYCLNLYHETQKAITYPDMKSKRNDQSNEAELDADELMELLDFDDQM